MEENRHEIQSDFDQAIAGRLARLRTLPIDTTRLDKKLRAEIPEPPRRRWYLRRRMQAVAASILLLTGIAITLVLTASSGPALASMEQMAQVHRDIVAGRVPIMRVDSIPEANRMLTDQAPGSPSLPNMPDSHVMACCMKSVNNKKMACVLLNNSGAAITLAVARASDMKSPDSPVVVRNGISFHVQSVNGLSMVMTERNGKWLCLISDLPADRLMDIAAQIQF